MANDEGKQATLETMAGERDERQVYLDRGRTLIVASEGLDEVIEIRASSGQVELRVVLTEEGPVLKLDGVRLSVKAAEAVEVHCKTFAVNAKSVQIASEGDLDVTSQGETRIRADKDVRVNGEKIFLN